MELARGDAMCFVDNDTEFVQPDWLHVLCVALDEEERCGMVGPKLLYPSAADGIQCAGAGVTKTGRVVFYGRGAPADDPRYDVRREVQFLISACLLFPRRLADEIGGLDEAFNPVQYEDTDFCYRARSRGYRAVYVPEAQVVHHESATTFDGAGSTNAYLVIKHGLLFKKRWRHMFEAEDGPPDSQAAWRPLGRWSDGGGRER
jgi:GT2 family glycosyltransferase